jgi:hypothetical protein
MESGDGDDDAMESGDGEQDRVFFQTQQDPLRATDEPQAASAKH